MNRHERRKLIALIRHGKASAAQCDAAREMGAKSFPWLGWRLTIDAMKGTPRSFQRSR